MEQTGVKAINHYRILEKLGAGGMGEVYLAEDTRLGRKVALKILPGEFRQDSDRLRRFQQEARAASSLNHPNILTIYEIGSTGADEFIAMEFIEGETLRQFLSRGPVNLMQVLEIATQISGGLTAAHEAGIIHRDIKPENIMLRRDGYVKILDFGLAKPGPSILSHSSSETATLGDGDTEPGTVVGTVSYMSPEQARGQEVDVRTDIFSLGVVIYEMVSGRQPFEASNVSDRLAIILSADPPPVARFAPACPAELQRILSKALAKRREARYQTARDLLIDLKSLKQRLEVDAELGRSTGVQMNRTGSSALSSSSARRRKSRGAIDSVAILPLENSGGDAGTEYLSDGITESIINALSRLPKLRVMARSTVFRYKGRVVDPQKIGRELSVRALLTGKVLQLSDNLVIKVELVDVEDGSQLWGEHYRRRLADIFAVEEEISQEISEKLRLKLTGEEKQRLSKRFTRDPEAYQLYLKGRFHWNKRTKEGLNRGIEYFKQAIAADPDYALAHAGLADSNVLLGWFAFAVQPPSEAMPRAEASAKRAIEIDEQLAEAHVSLATTKLLYGWDWAGAGKEYRRAIELNPNYATAHQWYTMLLTSAGRYDEALTEIRRALELEPLSLMINVNLGWILLYARRFSESLDRLIRTLEMDRSFYPVHLILGYAWEADGAYKEALAAFQTARMLDENPTVVAALGHCHAVAGETDQALKCLNSLDSGQFGSYVPAEARALIYAGLSNSDRAFEWLQRAVELRSNYVLFLNADPRMDPLRADSRFADLVRRIGL